jgi:hypothetical protein
MPSMAMITATFTLEEEAGDLSEIPRKDYWTELRNERIHMSGYFTRLRSHIPWARPKNFSTSHSFYTPEIQKRDACERVASEFEIKCWQWLSRYFPGRFSAEDPKDCPTLRIYLTQSSEPFDSKSNVLSLAGLGFSGDLWRSADVPGWHLSLDSWRVDRRRRFHAIAAARRSDAAKAGDNESDALASWALTQEFHQNQTGLFVRWAMRCLLSVYADRLSELRDHAATQRRIDTPVRRARELDHYLLGDGLDAVTVASEIQKFAEHLRSFRYDVVEYTENLDHFPDRSTIQEPSPPNAGSAIRAVLRRASLKWGSEQAEVPSVTDVESRNLVPALRDSLRDQAARLLGDIQVAANNIGASAELRQAIANTRMQRAVVLLAIIATLASVLGVWISINS